MAWCLKRMPARLASAVLLQAIARHAWTFAGSGRFVASGRHPVRVALFDCPLCRGAASEAPRCSYYLACFQHLFRTLVHPRARVNLRGCAAAGADACRFDIDW
jgi:divinyl protochlorophyllide a 8-vinyl-reductase